jgi:hypothetical protein
VARPAAETGEKRSPRGYRCGDTLSRCCEYFASRQTDQQT